MKRRPLVSRTSAASTCERNEITDLGPARDRRVMCASRVNPTCVDPAQDARSATLKETSAHVVWPLGPGSRAQERARPGHESVLAAGKGRVHHRTTQKNAREDVMPNDNDGRSAPRDVSRRHLFKQVGLAGAAAAVTATAPGVITAAAQPAPAEPTTTAAAPRPPAAIPTTPLAAPRLEALETLTAAEADTLEAIVARLIPTDENGPGATEARAAHYID